MPSSHPPPENHSFSGKIGKKAHRKLKARHSQKSVWFAVGMFGMVGWAVTLPTLMGLGLGIWLDRRDQGQYSWTLMLLVLGLGLGCWNAWYWVTKESRHD
ncbi:f0f1-atpase subunit [Leptolyngbya sp. Heron Island J]|uniref:AtpZ/AtpI family protein n=1 Tax=Leptolyngbya sp. Heron Island J TaxID=1385935 RepID=UPI0003B93E3C|nr:AtpZ/AtpI family protein [Leptolyngbya sp. Heron Island J]ESA37443.1 f0f1-atpase subunit [Leptolyngbya sp. Heron Island J]